PGLRACIRPHQSQNSHLLISCRIEFCVQGGRRRPLAASGWSPRWYLDERRPLKSTRGSEKNERPFRCEPPQAGRLFLLDGLAELAVAVDGRALAEVLQLEQLADLDLALLVVR